ncbi:MAG: DUF4430 domain-containing protein [Clostridia bacterium]|nr:DUF4430 domain-containing protein [Clostridia bacterium]
MKKSTIAIRAGAILAVLSMLFCLCACGTQEVQQGEKNITVTVVYEDKTQKEFEITTDAENLGDALYEQKLVTEEEHKTGFYNTIDGVRADYTLDKAWWCFTKGGEMTTVGANDLAIADGEVFEITHTPA